MAPCVCSLCAVAAAFWVDSFTFFLSDFIRAGDLTKVFENPAKKDQYVQCGERRALHSGVIFCYRRLNHPVGVVLTLSLIHEGIRREEETTLRLTVFIPSVV